MWLLRLHTHFTEQCQANRDRNLRLKLFGGLEGSPKPTSRRPRRTWLEIRGELNLLAPVATQLHDPGWSAKMDPIVPVFEKNCSL